MLRKALQAGELRKNAFTLVELMVAVTIMSMLVGTGVVYLNRFNARQKLESVKSAAASNLRLAQNYAKTRQRPAGASSDVIYVEVRVANGNLIAGINGVGTTYFVQTLVNSGIGISLIPAVLYYQGGSGQLAKDTTGSLFGAGETATVVVRSTREIAGYSSLSIDALGSVTSGAYVDE